MAGVFPGGWDFPTYKFPIPFRTRQGENNVNFLNVLSYSPVPMAIPLLIFNVMGPLPIQSFLFTANANKPCVFYLAI